MKFLVAIVLLALAAAGANQDFEHTLRGPRFEPGRLYKYDLELNVTATILGLSTQSSAAVFKGDLNIFAKTEKDLILQVNRIFVSDSVKSIESKYGDIHLHNDQDLFERLNQPIKFTFENGKVTSYTLSNNENIESKKIKKSILRSFEMHVPESALLELETYKNLNIPVTYNTTEETEFGHHISQYMVTSSPNPDFPSDRYVYNISRIENFEAERYPAHKLHHNFQKQGCPEVCRKDWKKNEFGAGCPTGYEAHQSPMKISFGHEHHLSRVGKVLNPEVIRTVEVHIAKMYDQDMEVLFRYRLTRRQTTQGSIAEVPGQKIYTDLHDWGIEINEKEIEDYCGQKSENDYLRSAKNLLSEIAKLIVEGDLDKSESNRIGEKVILLQDALSKLNVTQLRSLASNMQSPSTLKTSSDEEKVKRQIWLNILPTVGTTECVKFITDIITEGKLMRWEMKEILEALPQNIQKPNEEVIRALNALTEKVALYSHHMHSAVYLSLAKVIGKACGNIPIVRSQPKERSSWLSKLRAAPEKEPSYGTVKCPANLVHEIIKDVIYKLKCSHKPEEIVIFIETLAHIGTHEVLPVLTEYVYGTAENLKELSQKHVDFLKTVTQFALHNLAGKYPEEVLKIVLPVFFNQTETPRVRNAAFGVTIRCQPSLDVLQKLAIHSWVERSYEVGSYLTSTLETFGNSSLPCMQLTARRIKVVLPQFRRFDIGIHHAKNYFWNYFDDHREFGLEKRIEYIPSNESIIPSVFYKSLSYSLGSLKDVVVQTSLNGEGLTHETIMRIINNYFAIENIPTIPNEAEVFGEGEKGMKFIKPRTPEDPRFTVYGKMFYQSSYYYLDSSTLGTALSDFQEVVEKYLITSSSMVSGYFVKLMVPSSYHSVSVAKTVPYPVEFRMKQPIIFALKVKNLGRRLPTPGHFHLHLRPSVFLSKLFTHQVKNLGDCKEVGTYHEHKVAASYNFEIKYDREIFPNVTIKYKVPQSSNKKLLTYFTESGTHAGKKEAERLPSTIEREPIKTLPTPYKFDQSLKIIGLPSLRVQLTTEDTNIFRLPRNPTEALHMAVKKILNAGWRHKSVNITFLDDHSFWKKDTEVNFRIRYLQQHVPSFSSSMKSPQDEGENWSEIPQSQRQTKLDPFSPNGDIDWSKIMDPDEPENKIDIPDMTEKAKGVSRILNYMLPHVNHLLNISVVTYPEGNTAYFQMDYNHTYNERLHSLRVDTAAKIRGEKKAYEMSLDHVMGFWSTPSEFTYDSGYGKQEAFFVTALGLPRGGGSCCRWEKVNVAAMGHLKYVPNKEILKDDLLVSNTDDDYFMPEKHRQCWTDVRQGRPMSNNCLKAIQELSIYNRLNMFIAWEKVLPKSLRQFFRRSDIYLKHVFYDHLNITEEENIEKLIAVKMDYIDKLVDEPVIDLKIRKPTETVMLHRLPARGVLPLSSVYSMFDNHLMKATNNSYMPTCSVSEKYVKTFDLKTYPFSPEECHYVVTAHCTQRKNFAVIMKGTKEVHVHVGANRLILTPRTRTGKYVVQLNGEQHEVTDMMVLVPEEDIYAYTMNYGRQQYITVVAKKAGIELTYRKILKIVVNPLYKGELCGLCSEFDGEELREFRGMDRCLYESHLDFARSAMVKRTGQCRVDQPKGRAICDGDEPPHFWSRGTTTQEEYEPRTKRNIVITKGNEMCFSVHAVPVCEGDDVPNETETQLIGFHCLPKHDVTAKRLANEAKWRTLEELERKSVDYEDSVEVAKMC